MEFMPEHLIQLADQRGLIIMMHLSKQDAIADPENLADLEGLSQRYPRVRWILAHCARSYSCWAIDNSVSPDCTRYSQPLSRGIVST